MIMFITLIFLSYINIVLSNNYWARLNETITLNSNITNDTNNELGIFWNSYNNTYYNNTFNNIAICGKKGIFCECNINYNTSISNTSISNTSIYNVTNNCSLTIFLYDDNIFKTYQLVYQN
ncbi:pEP402R_1 [African swine fever virus]|nr:pEP402R_1 [African swine fever virus]